MAFYYNYKFHKNKKEKKKQVELLYDHAVYKPWSNYKKIKHFFI